MKIILDTNIYRNLIRDKTPEEIDSLQKEIIDAAKNKSIIITFPIIPAMELINHYTCLPKKQTIIYTLNLLRQWM